MKRILTILASILMLASCVQQSTKVPLPPVWAFGYWQQLPEGVSLASASDSLAAIRNLNAPADVFVLASDSLGSVSQREAFAKAKGRIAATVSASQTASKGFWKSLSTKGADAWMLDDLGGAQEMLRGMRKDGQRPCLLSAMDPGQEMLGVARRISAGQGWEGFFQGFRQGLELAGKGVPFWQLAPAVAGEGDDAEELRLRSLQLQSFLPMPCTDVLVNLSHEQLSALRMRYKIKPTVYSAAAAAAFDGAPMVQPLGLAFPEDAAAARIEDEFIFGGNMLVAPVFRPGVTEREVYLPQGCVWYDFASEQQYQGGSSVAVPASLSHDVPLFLKAGSMVFVADRADHYSTRRGMLLLYIYPDGNDIDSSLYLDDGTSLAYEKGERCWIEAHWNDAEHLITLTQSGDYDVNAFQVYCIVVGKGDRIFEYDGGSFTTQISYNARKKH